MSATRSAHLWGFALAAIALLGWAGPVAAAQCCDKPKAAKAECPSGAIGATLEGANFCVGCSLKKSSGAGAQCSVVGCKHAFKVTKAVGEDGKELTCVKGWVLHYLETEKSKELI